MQIRPVTCIHVAVYLFSAVVLAVSAFSYYREVAFEWASDDTSPSTAIQTQIFFDEGHFIVYRYYDMWWEPFRFSLLNPESIESLSKEFRSWGPYIERQFLGVRYLASIEEDGTTHSIFTAVPLWVLLILPLTWMCGFHLFRLRWRLRTELSV